ncbi:PRELI/MSF1 domain-containing protein [Neofusicoccum parvum]|uniref:Phospholipid metabolism protein n=2 Tax=Neofusicoccum TaxID=407951 RepID=A0ABR3SAY8_9PEZI|nr:PRELI/MSF1 domain-containing protein [Neofusicoccum parvum]GME49603.1 PRELI/MSF1 domain-containing protein [Neofusicoccum parvum]
MKIFSTTHDFNYSWEEVSINNWRKYCPWNEKTPHVIAVDTLDRHVDPETGILRTERLITCKQSAPKWLSSFLGGQEVSHVYETSYVDPKSKKVTMTSVNMTWSDLLEVRETVVYKPSATNPNTNTTFEQNAQIVALCGGWQKVRNGIEQFTVERFQQNAARGREGFEMVLEMSRRAFAQERELRKMQLAKI